MARYIVKFEANRTAWPIDPAEVLTLWEAIIGAGTAMIEDGTFSDVVWTSGMAGYAVVEAPSKDGAIAATTPFFPLFTQTIEEAVSWADGTAAILAGARAAAGQ
jgi:hypothetical protein